MAPAFWNWRFTKFRKDWYIFLKDVMANKIVKIQWDWNARARNIKFCLNWIFDMNFFEPSPEKRWTPQSYSHSTCSNFRSNKNKKIIWSPTSFPIDFERLSIITLLMFFFAFNWIKKYLNKSFHHSLFVFLIDW